MSTMNQPSTSQNRPYQGYPYVNPVVFDAPSIDPSTASKWANLPRRPTGIPIRRPEVLDTAHGEGSSRIRLPDSSASTPEEHGCNREQLPDKKEPDDTPVVYIDLPEEGGSGVAQNRQGTQNREQPSFVQETIFYDPFEDRRIDMSRGESVRSGASLKSDSNASDTSGPSNGRPIRPTILELGSPSSSNQANSSSTPRLPPFLSKEAYIYGRQPIPDDGFPLSPIPVTEFPEPPPAYTEFDRTGSPQPIVDQPRREAEPPRTQVIVPQADLHTPIGLPNPNRKFLTCHHCSSSVHTLVIRETGVITHIIALVCFLICFPMALLVYYSECFKNKNHYCPNCNKLIGYEWPILGQSIVYVH